MIAATVLATLEISASGVEFFNVISQFLTFDHVGTCFFFCESINNTYSPETAGYSMKFFEEDFDISTWPFVSSLSRVTFTINLVQCKSLERPMACGNQLLLGPFNFLEFCLTIRNSGVTFISSIKLQKKDLYKYLNTLKRGVTILL